MERFWSKVDRAGDDECWRFTGGLTHDGYVRFWFEGGTVMAHRMAYELAVGPIPDGLTLDHVRARGCSHRDCCNPAHLEPTTIRENTLRGDAVTAQNARKTHCKRGHEFTAANTLPAGRDGKGRACRTCTRAAHAISNAKSNARRSARRAAARAAA